MSDPGFESRTSPIAGLGLFTTRTFSPGERIVQYQGKLATVPPAQCESTCPVYTLEITPGLWLDGSPSDNLGRHANHSCEPNAELVWDNPTTTAWLVAVQAIATGHEVTFDYGFSLSESLFQPCRCGAVECVGRIIAAPLRPNLRRHLRFSRPRD